VLPEVTISVNDQEIYMKLTVLDIELATSHPSITLHVALVT
jgi:hypothetical protein